MTAFAPAVRPVDSQWSRLLVGDVQSHCRADLEGALAAVYERHRWVYDSLVSRPDTRLLRGRQPVLAGMLGEARIVVKRMHHGGVFASIGRDRFLTSSRARLHVDLAEYLTDRGIGTAPVAFASWRRINGLIRCEVGFELIEGGVDADRYFFGRPLAPHGWEARAQSIGAMVARLHEVGFLHADLNLMNFLFTGAGETYILDLDKSTPGDRRLSPRERSRNLQRLERSIRKQGRKHTPALVDEIVRVVHASYADGMA